jgi:hypothetical protein
MRTLAAGAALLLMCGILWPASDAYRAQIEEWRRHREAALKADGGWLTVTGLFWLHEGDNTFGSASPSASIVLPAGPGVRDGAFDLHNGKVAVAPGWPERASCGRIPRETGRGHHGQPDHVRHPARRQISASA